MGRDTSSLHQHICLVRELSTAKNPLLTLNYGRNVKCFWLGIFQIPLDLKQEANIFLAFLYFSAKSSASIIFRSYFFVSDLEFFSFNFSIITFLCLLSVTLPTSISSKKYTKFSWVRAKIFHHGIKLLYKGDPKLLRLKEDKSLFFSQWSRGRELSNIIPRCPVRSSRNPVSLTMLPHY